MKTEQVQEGQENSPCKPLKVNVHFRRKRENFLSLAETTKQSRIKFLRDQKRMLEAYQEMTGLAVSEAEMAIASNALKTALGPCTA